jgi:glutamyl-tRNA synthetase
VNVVDDLEMNVTHVIRGEDHLTNTAKHISLFRAFGVEPPKYAHIPLILNIDGSKMSKRDQGASLATYMSEGYAPEAVVNYLALLGWSPKANREKLAVSELIELFDVPQILRHNARFDIAKLHWLNGEYIREMSEDRFYEQSIHALAKAGIDTNRFALDYVKAALDTCKGKFKIFADLPAYGGFYFKEEVEYDAESAQREFTPENLLKLSKLREALGKLEPFTHEAVGATIASVAKECGVKTGVLVHPTRVACCGTAAGPSLYHLIAILGKERTLRRIDTVLARA